MITGIIAVIILIAVLPPAISNGQTGVVIAAVIVAVLVLAIGAASREEDRAYLNFMDHWANGGKSGSGVKSRRQRQRESRRMSKEMEEWERVQNSFHEGDERCPACRGKIGLAAVIRDKGEVKNLYMCTKCGRQFKGNPIQQ